jgi:DNA-binding response OmpR family regulator
VVVDEGARSLARGRAVAYLAEPFSFWELLARLHALG